MLALTQRLVDAGFAYPSGGSVWFRVGAFADYGALSHQRPDAMLASPEAERGKTDPRDFALWKAAKAGEPSWDSSWGPGRPGWHLECSAMAGKYLGDTFDIHGGGIDLVFPHHENERAQTMCGTVPPGGEEMARYWMHVGLLTTGGTKMSKSLGNSSYVPDALELARPQVLRYHLLAAHYRSSLEYGPTAGRVDGPPTTASRRSSATRWTYWAVPPRRRRVAAEAAAVAAAWSEFAAALDDDLGVARGLAAMFGAVSRGNQVLSKTHSRGAGRLGRRRSPDADGVRPRPGRAVAHRWCRAAAGPGRGDGHPAGPAFGGASSPGLFRSGLHPQPAAGRRGRRRGHPGRPTLAPGLTDRPSAGRRPARCRWRVEARGRLAGRPDYWLRPGCSYLARTVMRVQAPRYTRSPSRSGMGWPASIGSGSSLSRVPLVEPGSRTA